MIITSSKSLTISLCFATVLASAAGLSGCASPQQSIRAAASLLILLDAMEQMYANRRYNAERGGQARTDVIVDVASPRPTVGTGGEPVIRLEAEQSIDLSLRTRDGSPIDVSSLRIVALGSGDVEAVNLTERLRPYLDPSAMRLQTPPLQVPPGEYRLAFVVDGASGASIRGDLELVVED